MASGLGSLTLSPTAVGFNPGGTAMVPVTTGAGQKLGTISIKSPMDTLKEVFFDMKESLGILVDQAKVALGIEKRKDVRDKLKGMDTGGEAPAKGLTMKESLEKMMNDVRGGFEKVDFGDKMKALMLTGLLLVFLKFKDKLLPVITLLVKGVQKLVGWLGGPKNSLILLFGGILAIKLLPLIKTVGSVTSFLGTGFVTAFKTLKASFIAMRLFLGTTLPLRLNTMRTAGKFDKALKLLRFAFKALRLMLTATLYPAIISMVTTLAAAMGPILGPIVVIAAIAAGIAAVLFSMKSGIEAFKNSLDSGDNMIKAIAKGLLDFSATLITLPVTLLKNLLGYIAGLLGFDGIKAAIDKFSFKDMIVNSFTSLIRGTMNLIKAIAKGAGAALAAAFPGGESPPQAFRRVFKEVMSGGEGEISTEGPEKQEGTETVRHGTRMNVDIEKSKPVEGNVLATAKSAMTSDSVYNTNTIKTINNETTVMKEKVKELLKYEMEKMKIEKDGKSNAPIMVNNVKQGDNISQSQNTNIAGDLEVNNTEYTQKAINEAMA